MTDDIRDAIAAAYARPRLPSWAWLPPVVAFLTGLLHLYALAKVMRWYWVASSAY